MSLRRDDLKWIDRIHAHIKMEKRGDKLSEHFELHSGQSTNQQECALSRDCRFPSIRKPSAQQFYLIYFFFRILIYLPDAPHNRSSEPSTPGGASHAADGVIGSVVQASNQFGPLLFYGPYHSIGSAGTSMYGNHYGGASTEYGLPSYGHPHMSHSPNGPYDGSRPPHTGASTSYAGPPAPPYVHNPE
ncbi:hypothetical protein SUGI_1224840 [Cryptomeria japonica]|uniref:Uncharacterized protein n=1 Tax=Cryptomeria japonica TaxID=3369 RepID=A0AAD3RPB9_CRYJA|nr:hypothetical protein SUGI_1224840 [Cryptomeria japonica]